MPHGHPPPPRYRPRRPCPPPAQPSSTPLHTTHTKRTQSRASSYAISNLRPEPGRFAQRSNEIVAKVLEGDPEGNATRQGRSRRQSWKREAESRATELSFPLPHNNLRLLCHSDAARPCSTGAEGPPYGFRTLAPPPPPENHNSQNKAKVPAGNPAPRPPGTSRTKQTQSRTSPYFVNHLHAPPLSPPRFPPPARQFLCDAMGQRSLSARRAVSEYGN
jgi:hypothetical protein